MAKRKKVFLSFTDEKLIQLRKEIESVMDQCEQEEINLTPKFIELLNKQIGELISDIIIDKDIEIEELQERIEYLESDKAKFELLELNEEPTLRNLDKLTWFKENFNNI